MAPYGDLVNHYSVEIEGVPVTVLGVLMTPLETRKSDFDVHISENFFNPVFPLIVT